MKENWFFHDCYTDSKGRSFFEWDIEKEVTLLGWLLLISVILGYLFIFMFFRDYFGQISCLFRILFGVYCPMCGGSRAALYMVTGHILESLYYNPTVIVTTILGVPFIILNSICVLSRGKILGMRYHSIYLVIVLAVSIGNCIVKNWILLSQGIALIP